MSGGSFFILFTCLLLAHVTQSALAIEYRLSKDIVPQLYDIHIKPYLLREDGPKQFTFEGQVNITLHAAVKNLSIITLHKDRINIFEARLYNAQGNTREVITQEFMEYENVTDKLSLHLSSPLEVLTAYILYFKYEGEIRNGMAGFYRGTYDNDNWYGMTQLHRIDARTAFPCFDEPEFKAKFQMHISRPKQQKAYFNTRLIKTTADGAERVIDHFEATPLMSTYLVAFLISDFEYHGNEDLRIIMHSQFKNKTNYAFEVALRALEAYDNYTGMPYKTMGNSLMQKVGSNHFPHSGMENWGLIIYKDSALALEPGYTDGWSNKQTTVSLVVHEIGHMWFGNSVTHKWWSYFWLNEAFPNYYQYFLGQELYPEYELEKQFVIKEMHKVFDIDASSLAQPMSSLESSINTPEEIGSQFSDFAYAKGASIVRMFANLMGKENFDLAIREYLKENHLKAVEPENLFKFFKKYWPNDHNIDLNEFFKDWTEQVGYPMVMVSVTSSGRFAVKQKRFLLDPADGSDASLRYTIPITFNNHMKNDFNDLKPKFYLTKDQEERQFGNASHHKWLLVNAQQSNYYRVFYDSELLKEIRQVLMEFNHTGIPVNNRANLVDDMFTYGRIGLKDYEEVLNFMEYLASETEYSPWQAAFKGLDIISKRLTLAQKDKFKVYLYDIMAKVYEKLGFENPNVTILDIYNRNQVIAWLCKYHHEDCNSKAQTLFRNYFRSNTKPSPDFRETLYCAANRIDKSEVYENLREIFSQQQPLSEKEKLLKAMGCSRYRVKDHYEFLLSENVAKEMKVMGFNSLYSQTPENIVPVFHLMIENVEQLAESLDSWPTTAKVISDIANYLTTQEELSILKEFTEVKGHLFGTSITMLENAIQTTEKNLKWSHTHLNKLINYLTQRNVDYRLNKDVMPLLYDIHLKPYLRQEDGPKQFTFDGEVNITIKANKEDIKRITLHKDLMDLSECKLYDSKGSIKEHISSGNMLFEPVTSKLTLYLAEALEIDANYTLHFKYQGQIRNGTEGIFKASYDNINWYALTQLHRIDARTAFPCFDEPEFKAKFQMHISRPKIYNSVFNTRLLRTTNDGFDRVVDHFEVTPLMSTYLVAFLISDFESYGTEDLRIIMHSIYANKTNLAFEVGLKALEAYDNYTGMPYKSMGNTIMQKVGSPNFPHSGMENWGLVIYKDTILANEPGFTDGWLDKQTTIGLVVHETAHMWFGNSVTHKWWSYFWLNEAFARYYQYFMAQQLYPEYEFDQQFMNKQLQMIFNLDATNQTQPLTSPQESVNTPIEIGDKFSSIAYAKGAAIVYMFRNLMGQNNFNKAIREYLKENHLNISEPENLFKNLKSNWPSGHNVDLDEFFKDWTEQEGYPMLNVSVINGRYVLRQQRFLLDPLDGSDSTIKYTIPITFTHDRMANFSNLTPKFYLNKTQTEKVFGNAQPHKWTMFNVQQAFYYRVYYDDYLLQRLKEAFKAEQHSHIHVYNRASMVDDLFAFAQTGLRPYDEVMQFMEYLATETEYLPWQAAFKGFEFVSKRLTVVQQDKFKHYLYDIIAKVYEKLGFENPNVTILDIYNRNQVIAWLCKYHHEDCNSKAQTLFRKYFRSNTKPSPDFRETLYCAANRNDKSEVYENLREMFSQQQPLSENEKLLKAMGCSRYHVKEHYEFLLSDNVTKEMKIMGLNSLYSQTAENIVPVFHLMIENVEQLAESLDSWPTTAKVISDIANYLTTQEELSMLKEFTEVKGHLFGTSITMLENAIQTTEKNLKWSHTHLNKLINYLTQRNVDYRLNKDVMPLLYDIHLKPYLRQEDGPKQFTFDGEVNITIKANKEDIKRITLHKDLMDLSECKLYDSKGSIKEHISSGNMLFEPVTSKLTLYLAEALEIDANYTLYFKYQGQIRNGTEGVFKASYDNINWYALTQLHRIDARTAFPCFDEPEFKAKFQMHISRPKIYNSVFNTRLLRTTNDGFDRVVDHFEVTPLMSTYLVAFLISDFESYGTEDLRIIMHSIYANKTNLAFEVGLKALEAYDNYTGMPYKSMGNTIMQKAGSPNFPHSGMENWGLVIYKDTILANEPGFTDGWLDKQTTIGLVVHETAHMWFGNSVTHKWWSYFWLNEAFARYYQYLMAQQLYPEYEFDQQFMNKQLQMIFNLDATNQTQPLTSPQESVNTPIEIGDKFSSIAYAKGAAIVYMFRNLMGQNNFNKAIREYLKENHLNISEPENLFKNLKSNWPSGHNVDLDEFFKDWTEQEGYPMLNVSVINGRYVLRQQRFLLDPLDGSDSTIKYTIPITFTHDRMANFSNLTPKFYLNKTQTEKVFGNAQPHKWTMFNVQQAFYYRVYYDDYLLQRLKEAFKAEQHSHIHVYNRASMVDDLFAFAQTGLRPYDEVMQFMEYLATETEYLPWQAAFKGFEFVSKRLTVVQQDKFKHYLYDIIAKVYEKLGFENPNVTILDIYNRNQVIAWLCKYHHEDCNSKAQTLFRNYFRSNTKPSPDFRETLYCAANRNDKSEVYENLREMFSQQQPLSENEKLLKAMGCSRYHVKEHYEFLLSDNVTKEMKIMGLNSLYSQTAENIVPVLHLMIENVEQLAESLDSWPTTAKVISDIANYLTTQEELSMLKEFTEVKGHLFGTSITMLENAIQTTEKNLKWSTIHMDKMMNYLLKRYHKITYRLEKDIVPELYDIYLKPYLQKEDGLKQFTFEGEVNITIKANKEDIKRITLHKDYIDISQVILYDEAGNMVENIYSGSWLYETVTDKLTLYLMNALAKETKYILYMKYQGQIRNGLAGVFRATYDNVNWYGITQMQRIDARTAFPCFDEPEFKAKFRMRINRPKEYNSRFNTRLTQISDKNERYIDHFEETPLMSTYLVAFLISDFDAFGYKDFRIIMHQKFNGKTSFAYKAGLKILNGLDNYTQIPYKSLGNEIMQKVGSTRFPHNGMENWGLVIYHDSVLAQEPDYTDGWFDKQYTITILMHETSHMWFGNSVTFKWWSYFWLNEAFARYYQYFLAHELYPEYELDKQFVINQIQLIFGTDATNNTQPLTSPEEIINTPSEIAYKFSGITYAKGAAIVRMFANLMGKENFDAAIREYLKDNHLRNVVPGDLFKYVKKYWPQEHKVDLDQLFKDWTEQEGYPMVTVSATPNGKYSLKQQRFLLNPQDGSNTSLRYTIPITFNNDKMTNFNELTPKFYFNKTQNEVLFGNPSHHTWLLLNAQQSNYYRVFYDDFLLNQLKSAFRATNHSGIDVSSRSSVIDDLFTYGSLGLRDYDEIFEFMEYLKEETEYLPWFAAFKGINTVYQRLTIEEHKAFAPFLYELLDKVYKKLGFEKSDVTVLDIYNRNKVISWLCRYQHEDCNSQARNIFHRHVESQTKPLPDFRETLYCSAVRLDSKAYYKLKEMFKNESLITEKEKILRALGCTKFNVEEQYEFILTQEVPQDLKTIGLNSLYSQTPENVQPVFELSTNNVEQLAEALQSWFTTANVISGLAHYLTTPQQLQQLQQFTHDKGHLFGSSLKVLENSIESTANNLKWADKHLDKLFKYLSQRNAAVSLNTALVGVPILMLVLNMPM